MKQLFRRRKAWLVLTICFVLCFGTVHTSYETDQDDSSDEKLAAYVDNPDYRIENGLVINNATNALESCRSDAQSVIIPAGVESISSVAFIECDQLQSVFVPEGVKEIEPAAFQGCKNLTLITLPTTLKAVYYYAFDGSNLDTLIIPRNTRLMPNLGQSEWYGVLDGCNVKTLVFCGTDGLFLPTTFANIKFPSDGSGRIVFWGNPPEYIDISGLQFNYRGGEVGSGTFTICYPRQYSKAWSPNGETEWNGVPTRALTWSEEQKLLQKAPKLFADEDTTDVKEYPGWSFDQYNNVTIYSEEGWYHYCIENWGMEINDLRFAEGVDYILEYFNKDSDEGMYPGPSEIKMKRLLLPASLTKANLDHMIFQQVVMADGNPYVAVNNGRLIDPDTGDVIWAPTEPTSEHAVSTPLISAVTSQSPSNEPTPLQQLELQEKANDLDPWIIAACVAAVIAAVVVVAVSILRRKSIK